MSWLLLRGLGREQRHWYDFPSRLREVVAPEPVYSLDLAGAGTERGRVPLPSVPWLARDIARRALAATSGGGGGDARTKGSWHILGLSLGGMVALELAWLWPERVIHTLVINASCSLSPLSSRLMPAAVWGLGRTLVARGSAQREAQVLSLTSALPAARRAEVARQAASFAAPSPLSLLSQLCAAARFSPPPAGSVRPALAFLGSRGDRLVSAACSRALAGCYGAPYEEHPWAGHDLTLDDPDWVCERVARIHARRPTAERPG